MQQGGSARFDLELCKQVNERVDRHIRPEWHAISTVTEYESVDTASGFGGCEPLRSGRRVRPVRPEDVNPEHPFLRQALKEVFEEIDPGRIEPDPFARQRLPVSREVLMGEGL